MKEEYEHKYNRETKMSHMTGKHRPIKGAKGEAIKKKMEGVKTSIGKVLRLHKGKDA